MYEIGVSIHEENDLYNPLDPDCTLLSDDVVSYINRKYQEKERSAKFFIHFISDVPVNEERVRENIRSYLQHEIDFQTREHRNSTLRQIRLFMIGIVFIAVWLLAARQTESIAVEVLSIIGSFAVWEAANIWISEKPHIRLSKLRLMLLKDTDVRFTVKDCETPTAEPDHPEETVV